MRTTTTGAYDLSPLYRSFVGLDRMAGLIDAATAQAGSNTSYPPYNVVRLSDDAYRIELAVAGFSDADLSIESEQNRLTVTGNIDDKSANDELDYLHRGIAERGFERRFQLADHVFVKDAQLANGLLTISLERELPEALKPRRIEIGSAARGEKLITSKTGGKRKAA
ncbi:heat-shock protein IbpA [Algimonas ampicilliniresistens]|jgi:molecular chaperone IbpA|uniref:Heat-shock protein IbpA n=1 Tax=Algimonas ampicilliniresistens TaxID=1298735 RepID=A0ABQ5VBG2_9PROT|nr:Hsp20 family protein [Algimonas ampicilliniresistens]GLQ24417.1 heat-shock protein IbpA [Algimonas ampicilliniresistens]